MSGRFRTGVLATQIEVASGALSSGPYLLDETTAVVRFIFPVDVHETPIQGNLFEPVLTIVDEWTPRRVQARYFSRGLIGPIVLRL